MEEAKIRFGTAARPVRENNRDKQISIPFLLLTILLEGLIVRAMVIMKATLLEIFADFTCMYERLATVLHLDHRNAHAS